MLQRIYITLISCTLCFGVCVAGPVDKRNFRISKNLSIYNTLFRELDMYYVDTLNYDKTIKGSIDNMLDKLDPYTVYMPEEETDDLKFMTTGEYAGIGAMIMKKGNEICISEPYEGMPAQRNDLRAGDIILEVDGKKVDKLSSGEVSAMLKGLPNTMIKIKVQRPGEIKPIEKQFLREKIQVNPVGYSALMAPKIGYVLLNEFTDRAAIEMKLAINELKNKHQIESLIIDLRNNGGGLIDEAVKILGYFVPKGTTVVTTKGKNSDANRTYKTPTEPIFPDLNIVVITNRSSASASEILAGAIQDLDRGVIVGERTFGKGLVQNIRPVGYGGHLKVTTAKYYIPSGRCIQAIDYSHRNEDGSVGHIPDSLTRVFTTKNGRKVRDGGGIVPDTVLKDERKLNIAYYIYAQNMYFDYATAYVQSHATIPTPDVFTLSDEDYKKFEAYLIEKKFSYQSQTQKYLSDLMDIAKNENLDQRAKAEFEALKLKLAPDISQSLEDNKKDVTELLSLEIIKRYYFQKGEIQFTLKTDKEVNVAKQLLSDLTKHKKMLTASK